MNGSKLVLECEHARLRWGTNLDHISIASSTTHGTFSLKLTRIDKKITCSVRVQWSPFRWHFALWEGDLQSSCNLKSVFRWCYFVCSKLDSWFLVTAMIFEEKNVATFCLSGTLGRRVLPRMRSAVSASRWYRARTNAKNEVQNRSDEKWIYSKIYYAREENRRRLKVQKLSNSARRTSVQRILRYTKDIEGDWKCKRFMQVAWG